MPLAKFGYQLPLELIVPEGENEQSLVADERMRNETARAALMGMYGKIGAPRWMEDFVELCKGGWPWPFVWIYYCYGCNWKRSVDNYSKW